MAGKGFRLRWQPTTVGGTISESMTSWTQVVNGSVMLKHIFLRSSGDNTKFDFKIVSPTGNRIFYRKDNHVEINEVPNILMRGLYVLTIENADPKVDTYTLEAMFMDIKDK